MNNSLTSQFGSFAFAALIIYLILRNLASKQDGNRLALARQHAFWCALIGYFASTSASWFDTLAAVPSEGETQLSMPEAIGAAATPAIWVAFIYIAGQFTWPHKLKPQRTASLRPRTLSGLIPKSLASVMLAVFAAGLLAMYSVRDVTGLAPTPEITEEDAHEYIVTADAQDGLRSAAEVLPYLGLSLALLLVAAFAATMVILRRKPLDGISEHDNRLLRITWLNRLYRTVTVLLAGTAGEALHFKARWISDDADKFMDGEGGGIEYWERMNDLVGRWDQTANFTVLTITIVMFFWRPPVNFESLRPAVSSAFARLREQLFAVQYLSAVAAILLVAVGWPMLPSSETQEMPTVERATAILLLLAGAALFYLLVNAAYLAYMAFRTRAVARLPKPAARLPLWTYVVAGLLMAASLYFLLFPPLALLWGFVLPNRWIIVGLAAALLAAHAGFVLLIRSVALPWQVGCEVETWYRQVLEFRSMRVVTGALVAMPLMGYGLFEGFGLFGLLIFCAPAVLALPRPQGSMLPETSDARLR